jgi:protein-S-isoprenylcysteine O-methyltransferase Ste14
MKWLGCFGIMSFVAQQLALAFPARPLLPAAQYAGAALYVVAFLVFWWTVPYARAWRLKVAFMPNTPESIIVDGPYRFVRHPFYASYLAFWLAGVLASQHWELLVTVAVMGGFYARAIRIEEQAFLDGPLSEPYRAYRASTGAIIPGLGWQRRSSPDATAANRSLK